MIYAWAFDSAISVFVTTKLAVSFNLSAPGAVSFCVPRALSNKLVSILELIISSDVSKTTETLLGVLLYFETIILCG